MRKLKTFEEFLNESVLNEAKFTDVWPTMPYGDWKSEYDIIPKIQRELYTAVQNELGNKNPKVKEEIKDLAKSPLFKEVLNLADWDAFYNWTNRSESTSVGAWKLKSGQIIVLVYQTYDKENTNTTQAWIVE
jgi:hypothetical protein